MTHFAKVSGMLERMIADVAAQHGETDAKILLKWRHLFRDSVRPLYWRHEHTGEAYMSKLLEEAVKVKNRIESVYAHRPVTPIEAYQATVRAEGSPSRYKP